jgi:protein tyrosine phosphatase (PTP) superfamily phosphohydrolase (DUF442 family)
MSKSRLAAFIVVYLLIGCQSRTPSNSDSGLGAKLVLGHAPVSMAGLHNVLRVSDKLISGSSPEGKAGFESLRDLGVQTIISVDGARPDVEMAHQSGLRYVHLPVGYDGISQEQAAKLARAVRDLPGPIYLHCHHGMHRGPATAAATLFCLDQSCSAARAIEVMSRAGADPRYTGLYAAPHLLQRPTAEELAAVADEFPETAPIPALAQAMVQLDGRWEHLQSIRKAGWKTPRDQPDLDPAHEALQLLEGFRELARGPDTADRPVEFRRRLEEAENSALTLERALKKPIDSPNDGNVADKAFERCRTACAQCHAKYRDIPQSR